MELDALITTAMQSGFPAVVALYLLVRLESKLDGLTAAIHDLRCAVERDAA